MCSKSIKLCKRAACLRWIPLNNLFIYLLSHNALMLQCFNVFCFLLFNVLIRLFDSSFQVKQNIYTHSLIGVGNQYNGNRDCGCQYSHIYTHTHTHTHALPQTRAFTQMVLDLWPTLYIHTDMWKRLWVADALGKTPNRKLIMNSRSVCQRWRWSAGLWIKCESAQRVVFVVKQWKQKWYKYLVTAGVK